MIEAPAKEAPAPRRRIRWPLWLGVGILCVILASTLVWNAAGKQTGAGRPATARVGSAAPEIRLPQLIAGSQREQAKLSSLIGHPVVVNFWATWCVPCREEFPAFEAKYKQYGGSHQLVIVGINAESDGGPAAAQQFVQEMGATFAIWLDTQGAAEEAYRVQALPTTFFIDREGVIQDIIVGGPATEDYLDKELKRIF